jgi:hypothetical protein
MVPKGKTESHESECFQVLCWWYCSGRGAGLSLDWGGNGDGNAVIFNRQRNTGYTSRESAQLDLSGLGGVDILRTYSAWGIG